MCKENENLQAESLKYNLKKFERSVDKAKKNVIIVHKLK